MELLVKETGKFYILISPARWLPKGFTVQSTVSENLFFPIVPPALAITGHGYAAGDHYVLGFCPEETRLTNGD